MATIQAVIVHPDDTVQITEIENSLGSFQAVVGGYIEAVVGVDATVYVNEEGLMMGLPFNPFASVFAQTILGRALILHGTALIVGPENDGNDTDVRPIVVDFFNYTEEN